MLFWLPRVSIWMKFQGQLPELLLNGLFQILGWLRRLERLWVLAEGWGLQFEDFVRAVAQIFSDEV